MNTATHVMVDAHEAAVAADIARLRDMSIRERSVMIERACESAMSIERSRLAAGMPATQPAPWPASTWEFLRKQAARVRT